MRRTIIAVLCILWTAAGAAGGQEPRRVGADEMEKLFDVDYRVETMAVDAQLIVAAGDRHDAYPQVAVYDRGAGKLLGHLDTQRVIRIWLRPPDGAICTVTTEGLLQTWHRSELHELTSLHLGGGYPAVDPSGRFLVVGQGRFEVMDSYSGNILSSSRPHGDRLTWEPPTFSGRSIICWSDMTLRRVDLAGGPQLWSRTFEPEIEHCLVDRAAGRLLMLHRGREEDATRMLFLDPRTGKTLRELSLEGAYIAASAAPDKRYVLLHSWTLDAAIFDVEAGRVVTHIEGGSNWSTARFTPDGRYLIVGMAEAEGRDRADVLRIPTARIFPEPPRVAGRATVRTMKNPAWPTDVAAMEKAPAAETRMIARYVCGGERLALATPAAPALILADPENGEVQHTLRHKARVLELAARGQRLATCDAEHNVMLWDGENGRLLLHLSPEQTGRATGVGWQGDQLVTWGKDGDVLLWDTAAGRWSESFGHEEAVTSVAFSPDGRYLLTGDSEGVVTCRDLHSRREVWTDRHRGGIGRAVASLAVSADARLMASAGLHTGVIIRRLADGERIDRFRGSMAGGRLAFSPDATLLLDMGSLGGWALHSGPTVIYHIPFRGRAYSVHAGSDGLPFTAGCAVSPDTASFALTLVRTPADKPGDHLQVRDLASGRRLAGFRTGPMEGWDGAGAIALGWHPDGRRLVAAGMDGMLYVCELPGSGAPSMSGDRNE